MDEREKQRVRQWIRNWEATQPVLARLRDEAIRNTDTAKAIEQLSDAFEAARRDLPVSTTSALVEQQRWFAKLRP